MTLQSRFVTLLVITSVLLALGYERELASSSLRLTVGLHTTVEDIDRTVETLADVVRQVARTGAAVSA